MRIISSARQQRCGVPAVPMVIFATAETGVHARAVPLRVVPRLRLLQHLQRDRAVPGLGRDRLQHLRRRPMIAGGPVAGRDGSRTAG